MERFVLVGSRDMRSTYNMSELAIGLIGTDPEREDREPFHTARPLFVSGVFGFGPICLDGLSPFDTIGRTIVSQTIPNSTSKPPIVSNHLP